MPKEKLRLDPETGEFVSVLNDAGQEIPDPRPMAPPVGFQRRIPLHERIRAMVDQHLRDRKEEGLETPEEADDFLLPDEDDARHGERFAVMPGHEHEWEENFDPPKDWKDMRDRLVKAGWEPPSYEDEVKADLRSRGYKEPAGSQEVSAVKPKKSDDAAKPLDVDGQE